MLDPCCGYPGSEQWDLLGDQPVGTCAEMHGRLQGWWLVRGRSRSFLCHPDGRCDCWSKSGTQVVTPCAHLKALKAHLETMPAKVPCPACKGHGAACGPCHSEGWVFPHEANEIRWAWPAFCSLKKSFQEDVLAIKARLGRDRSLPCQREAADWPLLTDSSFREELVRQEQARIAREPVLVLELEELPPLPTEPPAPKRRRAA